MEIGASSLAFLKYTPEETVKRLSRLNFDFWEIIPEDRHFRREYSRVRELVESTGIGVTVHAPFSDLNVASLNEGVRRESISQICESIKTAKFLKADLVTFHPGRLSPLGIVFEDKAREANIRSLEEIVGFAKRCGVKICMENSPNYRGVFCTRIPEVKEMLAHFEGDLNLTLDVGHANTVGRAEKFISPLKKWISHLHIHDNKGDVDQHSEIGAGNINFAKVMKEIKRMNYSGKVVIEAVNEKEVVAGRRKLEEILSRL